MDIFACVGFSWQIFILHSGCSNTEETVRLAHFFAFGGVCAHKRAKTTVGPGPLYFVNKPPAGFGDTLKKPTCDDCFQYTSTTKVDFFKTILNLMPYDL